MEYFMDDLQDWEVYDIYNLLQYADVNSWEQTRWLMYVIAQVNSRKQLKAGDILKLPWDADGLKKSSISNEDIAKLKKRAELLEKEICKQ